MQGELDTGADAVRLLNEVTSADHLPRCLADCWSLFLIVLITIAVGGANHIRSVHFHPLE